MKYIAFPCSIILLLLLVTVTPASQEFDGETIPPWLEQETPPEMSMPWGMPLAEFSGVVKYKSEDGVEYYRFPGSNSCPIFSGDTSDISLAFRDKALYAYFVEITQVQDFKQSLAEMMDIYGQPEDYSEGDYRIYEWRSGVEKIKIKFNRETGQMKLAFYHSL